MTTRTGWTKGTTPSEGQDVPPRIRPLQGEVLTNRTFAPCHRWNPWRLSGRPGGGQTSYWSGQRRGCGPPEGPDGPGCTDGNPSSCGTIHVLRQGQTLRDGMESLPRSPARTGKASWAASGSRIGLVFYPASSICSVTRLAGSTRSVLAAPLLAWRRAPGRPQTGVSSARKARRPDLRRPGIAHAVATRTGICPTAPPAARRRNQQEPTPWRRK